MLALCFATGPASREADGQDGACQLSEMETSALQAPGNTESLRRYEECLIESFEESRVLWHELTAKEVERVARELVSRTRNSTHPTILTSLNPALPLGIGLQESVEHDMGKMRLAAEAMSKNILARCTVDNEFADQYVHLVLWSGKFVVDYPNIDQSSALQIHLVTIEENTSKESNFWQYALNCFVVAELIGYRDQHLFPLEREEIAAYSRSLLAWAKERRFATVEGKYRWTPAGLQPKAQNSRLMRNVFERMELPAKPVPSLFDFEFSRLREELYGL